MIEERERERERRRTLRMRTQSSDILLYLLDWKTRERVTIRFSGEILILIPTLHSQEQQQQQQSGNKTFTTV